MAWFQGGLLEQPVKGFVFSPQYSRKKRERGVIGIVLGSLSEVISLSASLCVCYHEIIVLIGETLIACLLFKESSVLWHSGKLTGSFKMMYSDCCNL